MVRPYHRVVVVQTTDVELHLGFPGLEVVLSSSTLKRSTTGPRLRLVNWSLSFASLVGPSGHLFLPSWFREERPGPQ